MLTTSYFEDEIWAENNRIIYEYTDFGDVSFSNYQTFSESEWVDVNRYFFEFEDEIMVSQLYQIFSSGEWIDYLFANNLSDENGNIVEELWQYDIDEVTYNYSKYLYTYFDFSDNETDTEFPDNIELSNYPNPFNPTTTITYNLGNESYKIIELNITNIKGQHIKKFVISNPDNSKKGSIVWNGKSEKGDFVSSGIYFYQLKIDNIIKSNNKMILMK